MESKDPDHLVGEIEQIRARLAGNVDELVDRANPKAIAGREVSKVKAKFVNPDGSLRLDTIVPLALGVIGFIGVAVVGRKVFGD